MRRPLAPAALASGNVPAPEVALEAYALLRAELAVAPEHEAAVLAKYGLEDPAARRALDDPWRRLTAADPAARAELERLVAAHGEWLLGRPR